MDTKYLTVSQRQQRSNIRSLFLTATVEEMERAKGSYDAFGKLVLEEMIAKCRADGVDNFGETT